MTTFKEIQGRNIRAVSTDPANPGEGEMWYNKTIGVLKGVQPLEAWSSASLLSLARYGSAGAGTSQNAALVAAGTQAPAYTSHNDTEEYNGTGWATGGTYPTSGGGQRGCGSLTAALGTTPTSTNTYDGSTWTNLGAPSNLNLSRSNTWLVGSSTAGLAWGGIIPGPGTRTNVTEEWNGSAWTTSPGTISDSVSGATGFGIQTAALRVAGDLGPANTSNVDSYNGTTWTASTSYPISIKDAFGTGTQTEGLIASGAGGPGGTDVVTTVVSGWDGSAWSAKPSMGTSRRDDTGGSTSGPATAAVQGGGNNPPTTSIANTEEFNKSINVITPGAWSSGGTMGTARYALAGTGSQTAGLVFGGTPPARTLTESYDGTTWTEVNDLGTARYNNAGAGTQTAALAFGGGPGNLTQTEEFNGTSWSEQNDLSTGRRTLGGTGTQTAGLAFGGFTTVETGATEEYDGTNWSTGGSLNTARRTNSGSGTQTAGLAIAGTTPATTGATEEYDGSVWTTGGSLITARRVGAASNGLGTQNGALYFGGNPGYLTSTEGYDGVSWSTRPSLSTGRAYIAGFGSATASVAAANFPTSGITEEFTGETTSANVKTFTTS